MIKRLKQNKNKAFLVAILMAINLLIPSALGVEYTEDLLEVTDQGVFDAEGNPVEPIIEPPLTPSLPPVSTDSFEEYRQTIINTWGGEKAFTESRLQGIRENLQKELTEFKTFGETITEAEEKLIPLHQEIKNLTDQINLFNEQILSTREKITNAEKAIAEKEIGMKEVMEEAKEKEVELRAHELAVLDYITLLYKEEAEFMDLYGEGSNTVKLLLASSSVSENLLGRDYVALIEQSGRQVFHEAEESYRSLREKQAELLLSQTKLNRLYATLAQEKRIFEETRATKKELLTQSQGEKDRYEELLEESIRQQLESALAIQNMKDNLELIESKLALLDDKLEEISILPASPVIPVETGILPPLSDSSIDSRLRENDISGFSGTTFFDWPVSPRAITAHFEDPSYPKRWGKHTGLDIRAKQFTEIRAPQNGYVVEAKDNGFGYSYIILAHKKNLVTLYGHVYEILVKPGTLVEKGQVIGLTGGTPGTKGAGLQTTGPHLHFEVHEKGVLQNPLDYLPVFELPIEYIPERYLRKEGN